MSLAIVVLPAPVAPTRATVCPAGTSMDTSCSTGRSAEYPNSTASSVSAPRIGRGSGVGETGSGTDGRSASTAEIFSSAALADCSEL